MSRFLLPVAQQGGPLLALLPAELRLNIYAFVLEDVPTVIRGTRNTAGNGRKIFLLETCQQLYTECAAELYDRTTFEVVVRSDYFTCVRRMWYSGEGDDEIDLYNIYKILRHARRVQLVIFMRHVPSRRDITWFTSPDMAPHHLNERLLTVADLMRRMPLMKHLDISLLESNHNTAFLQYDDVREALRPFDTLRNLTEVRVSASCFIPVAPTFSLAAILAASNFPPPYTLGTFGPSQPFTVHGAVVFVQYFIELLQGDTAPRPFPLRGAWFRLHHCLDADRSLGFEILDNIDSYGGQSGQELADDCWEHALQGDRVNFEICAERLLTALATEAQAQSLYIENSWQRRRGRVLFEHLASYCNALKRGDLW